MLKRLASNAGANVVSGFVTAVYQLAITAIASRAWRGSEFATWALAMSIAAIVPLFGSNLSSVVTRRVVETRHSTRSNDEPAIVVEARRLARHLTVAAMLLLIVAGAWIHLRSASGAGDMSGFLALLGTMLLAQSWIVLVQARFGQYYADERNWMPAITLAAARIGGLMGMSAGVALHANGLAAAAAGLCAGTWSGLALARLSLPPPPTYPEALRARSNQYGMNVQVFAGFAIWSIGALIIQYGIPPVMAMIDASSFNAFYLASMLNMIAIGALGAAMSALLAPLSRWHATQQSAPLRRIALFGPIICSLSCVLVLAIGWYAIGPVLHALSTHAATIEDIRPFLALLGFQTIVRTAAFGYSLSLASTASMRQMAAAIVIEILVTFLVAAPLGAVAGARALLVGLVFAGLVSSVVTCWIGLSLAPRGIVRRRAALAAFVAAQALSCAAWWLITCRAF